MSALYSGALLERDTGPEPIARWLEQTGREPLPRLEGVQHRLALVGGVQLHYVEAGQGEPIVLLHGWPQHWWSFRKIIGPLAQKYRVICPDLRGLGWSGGSPRDHHFLELAADIIGLLDALGIQQTRLVGHDWGAAVGYTMCLRWPERVQQFIPLGAVTPWSSKGAPPWKLALRAWHIAALALLGLFGITPLALPRHALRAWRHTGRFTREELQTYLAPLRRPEAARATRRWYYNLVFHEIPFFVRHFASIRLRTPTLHLNGAQDPLTIGVPDSYLRYTDHMRLELISDCGHFIAEEQPDELVARIQGFFA